MTAIGKGKGNIFLAVMVGGRLGVYSAPSRSGPGLLSNFVQENMTKIAVIPWGVTQPRLPVSDHRGGGVFFKGGVVVGVFPDS